MSGRSRASCGSAGRHGRADHRGWERGPWKPSGTN
ncbi:MAG: hypothetical protein FGM42_09135 [Ilumatobacteraceae bacterium]|nr:hypothetical protein [Ilumatobacteraceae bacterium]